MTEAGIECYSKAEDECFAMRVSSRWKRDIWAMGSRGTFLLTQKLSMADTESKEPLAPSL